MDRYQLGNYISTPTEEKGKALPNTKECSVHGPVNTIDGLLLKLTYMCI